MEQEGQNKKYSNNLWNFGKKVLLFIPFGMLGSLIGGDLLSRDDITTYSFDVNSDGIEDIIEISENPKFLSRYTNILIGQRDGEQIKFVPYHKYADSQLDSLKMEISKKIDGQKQLYDKTIERLVQETQ